MCYIFKFLCMFRTFTLFIGRYESSLVGLHSDVLLKSVEFCPNLSLNLCRLGLMLF